MFESMALVHLEDGQVEVHGLVSDDWTGTPQDWEHCSAAFCQEAWVCLEALGEDQADLVYWPGRYNPVRKLQHGRHHRRLVIRFAVR